MSFIDFGLDASLDNRLEHATDLLLDELFAVESKLLKRECECVDFAASGSASTSASICKRRNTVATTKFAQG